MNTQSKHIHAPNLDPSLLDKIDEAVGGAVVRGDRLRSRHLGLDGLGELLAQLHAPLVVRVDVPDHALWSCAGLEKNIHTLCSLYGL